VCRNELLEAGASPYFARNVAHRLHSLTLEDIQMYFKADVGDENGIPTVNKDLESETRILENTPLADLDMKFTTPALRYMDLVLRNMDKNYYSITNFSVLEKLAHMYHMGELWQHASTHYSSLLLNPPPREVCTCASSSHLNSVTQELNLLALKIKYPGITSGEYNEKKGLFNDYGYGIHYRLGKITNPSAEFQRAVEKFDFSGPESEVVERVTAGLVDGDRGMEKKLDSEEGWQYWKEKVQTMEEIGNYEFAMYMYCKLNA